MNDLIPAPTPPALLDPIALPKFADTLPVPVRDWLSGFRSQRTAHAYAYAFKRWLGWLDGFAVDYLHPTVRHVNAYRAQKEAQAERHIPGAVSVATLQLELSGLRMGYRNLARLEGPDGKPLLEKDPFASIKLPRQVRETGATRPLSREQIARLIDSASCPRDRTLIAVMYYTAARVSAVCRLRRSDYLDTCTPRALQLHEKGNKLRKLPVTGELAEILDRWIERLPPMPDDTDPPLFRHQGECIERLTAWRAVRRAGRLAGLGEVHPHMLRASAITIHRQMGGLLEHTQWIAGHADQKTTRLYDHSKFEIAALELERLNLRSQ
jgi:integrase